MSTSFSPSRDLVLNAKVPAAESIFTTFSARHFIKPSQFTQPVKAQLAKAIAPAPVSFAGCFTEVFAAAPIDLDYDEPNACVEADLQVVVATESVPSVHQVEIEFSVRAVSSRRSERSAA